MSEKIIAYLNGKYNNYFDENGNPLNPLPQKNSDKTSIEDLPRKNGVVYLDEDLEYEGTKFYYDKKALYLGDSKYYAKPFNYEFSVCQLATDNFYDYLGFKVPQSTLMCTKGKQENLFVISHDAEDAYKDLPNKQHLKINIPGSYNKETFRWAILYDPRIREEYLKIMTPECFDEFINMMLVDELHTEFDRHSRNYYFYKSNDSEKFEGIIPIDNEASNIVIAPAPRNKARLMSYIKEPYKAQTPFGTRDYFSYSKRIRQIQLLIQNGLLNENNIEMIRKALNDDYAERFYQQCNNPYTQLYGDSTYTPVSLLWDYARTELDKEIDLTK